MPSLGQNKKESSCDNKQLYNWGKKSQRSEPLYWCILEVLFPGVRTSSFPQFPSQRMKQFAKVLFLHHLDGPTILQTKLKKASGKSGKLTKLYNTCWQPGYRYRYSVDKFLERGNDEFSIDVLPYQKIAPLDAVLHKTMRGPAGVSILLSLSTPFCLHPDKSGESEHPFQVTGGDSVLIVPSTCSPRHCFPLFTMVLPESFKSNSLLPCRSWILKRLRPSQRLKGLLPRKGARVL